ncbi:DUF1214 domain-containing protein [Actinocorallia libanotica]|uniref:DUF1214 domain-containing protein n=1 Tax=Actinocorallia libanotica TaxID=46162 RepID=A0ABN1Q7R2_9ACTN
MPDADRPEAEAWETFADALRKAGRRLAADTEHLDESERADAFRALLRGLHNQLARFEVDRELPELVPFNGWRQKFFMDNPDFRYWVADIRPGRCYRVTGNPGAAAYTSITVYAGTGRAGAEAVARLDSDDLRFDAAGDFTVTLGGDRPETGDWLPLPEKATALWVRYFHDDADDETGWCTLERVGSVETAPPPIDPARFTHHLNRLAGTMSFLPAAFKAAADADLAQPNEIRHWSEMAGGAVYTEPGIHYLRGGWELGPGEALVIEGDVVPCRYWNVLLYSRFLNSLDHRHRSVSRTGATANVKDGRYRFVLAAEDPGTAAGDWLDTEGRPFGIVVLRWLRPERAPDLPSVRRCRLEDLRSES